MLARLDFFLPAGPHLHLAERGNMVTQKTCSLILFACSFMDHDTDKKTKCFHDVTTEDMTKSRKKRYLAAPTCHAWYIFSLRGTSDGLGHMHRMDNDQLPKQLLYSQLRDRERNQGRPRLRFKDVAKRNMKWRDISTSSWQTLVRNRVAWRTATKSKPKP